MAECGIQLRPFLPSSLTSPASSRTVLPGGTWRPGFPCHDVGWKQIVHPDAGYYYVSPEQNICTWSNISDPRVHGLIMEAAQQLKRNSELQSRLQRDSDICLVLEMKDHCPRTCLYYFVSHVNHHIFWLSEHGEVKVHCSSTQCRRSSSQSHSRCHCFPAGVVGRLGTVPDLLDQYWKHCELFPTTLSLTHEAINYLKDVLIQASGERITLKYSTSPYTKDDLSYMLGLVKEIGEDSNTRRSDHSAWVIAKLMSLHVNGALRSSYGQSNDYFDIKYSESTARPPYQRSWFLVSLDLLLFRCADAYAEQLYTFHDHFSPESWFCFVNKVDTSIRDSNLLATVLLSTSIGVLQIGSIDAATAPGKRSAIQIIIYTSIIFSVGSIVIGLLIMQQYRAKGADTPLRAVAVLERILEKTLRPRETCC
ncbi:hypothetical protein EV401DRAFT_1159046 [Pisolithus croceorrhizus]|nr:hypothetical protein EV401DRAFT_1159046 [Pisolithus croceorrhizus]